MILNEILSSTKVVVNWRGNEGHFKVGDMQYIIQFIHVKPNDMIHGEISDQPITKNTWFFAFAAIDPTYGYPVDTRTNVGNAITVFSVVLQELEKFVERKNVDMLYFGGSAEDTKRNQLYQKIATKYTKKHNWKIVSETDAVFFGDKKHIWIVAK